MKHFDALYFQYLQERQGLSCLWDEHGFITYKITGDECFLADMFVEKSQRHSGLGRNLVEQLKDLASPMGCKVITANVYLDLPGADNTLRAAQAVGFKVERANNNVLLIALPIAGG